MKSTGIVRRIDDLGRVVIPKELRRTLGISEGDPMEMHVQGETIVIQRYTPGCFFCGVTYDRLLVDLLGKQVCHTCISKLNAKLQPPEVSD